MSIYTYVIDLSDESPEVSIGHDIIKGKVVAVKFSNVFDELDALNDLTDRQSATISDCAKIISDLQEWQTGLPPDNRAVWCVARRDDDTTYQFCGRYIRQWEEEVDWIDDWSEYNKSNGNYYFSAGWYENQFNWDSVTSEILVKKDEIIGWRHLPKAPKVIECI